MVLDLIVTTVLALNAAWRRPLKCLVCVLIVVSVGIEVHLAGELAD